MKTLARNAMWNWAGMVAHLLAGFVVAPFLIGRLGQTGYGLWILIASLTGYFCVLDLGISGAVGRNVALLKAKNDRDGVNSLFSTALAILGGVSLLTVLATLAAVGLFFTLFEVAPDQAESARLALMLVGCNLAAGFVLGIFDGLLWAWQRFDVQNLIDIPAVLLRTGLTFLVIGDGGGLAALALITLLTTVGAGLAKLAACFILDRGLRFCPTFIGAEAARCLYGYGVWFFLLSLARTLTPQISPQVIGARLGVMLVTPFAVAGRLVGYAHSFLIAGTGVVTPLATCLHAAEQQDRQQVLLVQGGKLCLAAALFFVTLFLCLGQPLLLLWMGPALASAWPLLVILAAGEVLPMSQWITYSLILGKGRHQLTAGFNMVEGLLVLVLALSLAGPHGLVGVALAVAAPAALCRGLGPLIHGCRILGVPLRTYLGRALLPPLLFATLPATLLALAVSWHAPADWFQLCLYGSTYGVVYLAICAWALVPRGSAIAGTTMDNGPLTLERCREEALVG